MKQLLEKPRDWDTVSSPDKVAALLRDKLAKVRFYMKRTEPPAEFYRDGERDGVFEYHHAPDLIIPEKLTLYASLKRHVEVDFDKVEESEPGTTWLKPKKVRVGKIQRGSPRINITNGAIAAANFQVSKNEIAVDNTRPQVANKVIFSEFEKRLSRDFPGLRIYDYATRERPQETHVLNRETRAILVEDVSIPETYNGGEGIFPYGEYLEEEESFEQTRRRYIERHLHSVLALPILYDMADGSRLPIGFIYAEAQKGTSFDTSTLNRLQDVAHDILERIQDANMITVKERQPVVNVSEGGVALELDHPDLVKYVPHRKEIIFDLIFKMQAPLRFRGEICHMEQVGPDRLFVGINLEGSGHTDHRQGARERLQSLVRLMQNTPA